MGEIRVGIMLVLSRMLQVWFSGCQQRVPALLTLVRLSNLQEKFRQVYILAPASYGHALLAQVTAR